ncbi:MAG: hypothetical protein RL489_1246 [Pseudomonadota bacterium]|jgi:hypothetical protein
MQDMFWNFTIRLRMAAAVAMLVGLFAVIGAMVWSGADRLLILGTMAAMLAVVVPLTRTKRQAPGFSPGSSVQAGTACCCSMY